MRNGLNDLAYEVRCENGVVTSVFKITSASNYWPDLWGYVDAGYIYYYDRCEGRYYPDFREEPRSEAAEAYRKSFSRDERAYACYLRAAESDEAFVLAEALAVESPILFAGLGEELVGPPHPASARHNAMQLTMMNRVRFISLLSL